MWKTLPYPSPSQRINLRQPQRCFLGKEVILTHGAGIEQQCCLRCEPCASECRDKAAGYTWSAGLFLQISQRLNSRLQDLVSKKVNNRSLHLHSILVLSEKDCPAFIPHEGCPVPLPSFLTCPSPAPATYKSRTCCSFSLLVIVIPCRGLALILHMGGKTSPHTTQMYVWWI